MEKIKIKVGYQTYKVELIDHEVVNDGKDCFGDVDFCNQVIRVSNIYPKERQLATLLHETVHALDDVMGIGLEEEQVTKLGTALAMLFIDNPVFLSIIK